MNQLTSNSTSMRILAYTFIILFFGIGCQSTHNYQMAPAPLVTDFAARVDPTNPLPEYPRPQMERADWINLNGLWDYTIKPIDFEPVQGLTTKSSWTTGEIPTEWTNKILVPFAIDAPLSGVGHILRHNEVLWYQRPFRIPSSWREKNVILHFEGCDWETSVYVNGHRVGQHRGGYDPFSFDISSYLKRGVNMLHVCVWDATENQSQAIGKQIMPENRMGFRYQPTAGIYKTVWMEPVATNAVKDLRVFPEYDKSTVRLNAVTYENGGTVVAQVWKGKELLTEREGKSGIDFEIPVEDFIAWSPDNPFLYDLKVMVKEGETIIDEFDSYFGMRKIEVKRAEDGFMRMHLNGEVLFQYGPLDQGYWPDGVLTPPSEEAIIFDLKYLKDIGCNMVRVHIKTHPSRWYYHADKLGLLVWQDMTCMPRYGQTVDDAAAQQWHGEFKGMVDWLHNHPSIIMWVVFNESWSQHNTMFYADWIERYDPNRIINIASGWNDYPAGHVMDIHDYNFYPRNNAADFKLDGKRALVIGEAAGINLAIPGHTWYSDDNKPVMSNHENYTPFDRYSFTEEGGRHTYSTPKIFEEAYGKFMETMRVLIAGSGADALVYTQITDVEHELNGYLTYDRKVSKIPVDVMKEINESLYVPVKMETILPFESNWRRPGGQAVTLPAGSINEFILINTRTTTPFEFERHFNLSEIPGNMAVSVKGFNNVEIYLNGELFRTTRMGARWGEPAIKFYPLFDDEFKMLKEGQNTIRIKSFGKSEEIDLIDTAVFVYK